MGRCESCGACKSMPWWAPERLASLPPSEARLERMRFELLEKQLRGDEESSTMDPPAQKSSEQVGSSAPDEAESSEESSGSSSSVDSRQGESGVVETQTVSEQEKSMGSNAVDGVVDGEEVEVTTAEMDTVDKFFDDEPGQPASAVPSERKELELDEKDSNEVLARALNADNDDEEENWFSPRNTAPSADLHNEVTNKEERIDPAQTSPEEEGRKLSSGVLDDSAVRQDSWASDAVWVASAASAVEGVSRPETFTEASKQNAEPAGFDGSSKRVRESEGPEFTEANSMDGSSVHASGANVPLGATKDQKESSGKKRSAVKKPPRAPFSEQTTGSAEGQPAQSGSRPRGVRVSQQSSDESDLSDVPELSSRGKAQNKKPAQNPAVWDSVAPLEVVEGLEPDEKAGDTGDNRNLNARTKSVLKSSTSAVSPDSNPDRPELCQECTTLALRVKELQENIQSLKSALAVREASNLEMRAKRNGSRSEQIAMLKQEISSLRVTCDYLFRKLQQAE